MFTFRDIRIPQGQGAHVKYRGNVNLYIYTVYRSKRLDTLLFNIFARSHLWSSRTAFIDQKFEYSLKYIFCNADLLSMLEPLILFSGLFDEYKLKKEQHLFKIYTSCNNIHYRSNLVRVFFYKLVFIQ